MLNVWGLQLNAHYTVTLPVSLGTLWAYISTVEDVYNQLNLTGFGVYHPIGSSVMDIMPEVEKNGVPDIIIASIYMWNRNRTSKITKAIKEKYPHVTIIVGGNDIPKDPQRFEAFMLENPQYDYYVTYEGEIPLEMIFREILNEKNIIKTEYHDDCYIRVKDGKITNKISTRRFLPHKEDLDIPSPCAMGIYDDTIKNLPEGIQIQGVLETNRGCPYSCTFCDWGLEEKLRKFSLKRIKDEVNWMVENVHEIMFSDANFGILERDINIAKYLIKYKLQHPAPKLHSTAITYAKNNKERVLEIAGILEHFDFSRSGATFSLQSMNSPTLNAIKRNNMSITNDFDWIAKNFIERGIPYYHEMIMGLPLETKKTFLKSLNQLLRYNPIEINVYKLAWLENSEISLDNHSEKYSLTWSKFEQGPSPYEDEKEFTWIISGTDHISTPEMQYIRHIRDLIQVLWLGKSLFYIGKYLQKNYDIEACDLIENLYNWSLSNGDVAFWETLYKSKEDAVRDKINSADTQIWFPYQTEKYKFHRYSNAWMYIHNSKNRKEHFYNQITKFIKETYPNVVDEMLEDVIHFNKNILICLEDIKTEHEFETKYSWINYFIEDKLRVPKNKKTTIYAEINVAGNTKISKDSVNEEIFSYYVGGGHEFMFNKQNSFNYQSGFYYEGDNIDQKTKFISRSNYFYYANSFDTNTNEIIKQIMARNWI